MSEWSHLPNAAHIDHVLTHAKANPDKWASAWAAARDSDRDSDRAAGWYAALFAAHDSARNAVRDAAWFAAQDAARDAAWAAARALARSACAALVAWDEAGGLLSAPVATVRFLAQEGAHAAVLLLPAAIAMEATNE